MKNSTAIELQITLQNELQKLGFNVVTCGNCGSVLIHKTSENTIDCICGEEMEICDCPDYWYEGCQDGVEFNED